MVNAIDGLPGTRQAITHHVYPAYISGYIVEMSERMLEVAPGTAHKRIRSRYLG